MREKTSADYETLERQAGVRFFHDAGRTAVASALQTTEARELAKRNPFRYEAFKRLMGDAARYGIETKKHLATAKRLTIINNLEEYAINSEAGLGDSRLSSRQHDVFHDTVRFLRGELPGSDKLTQAGYIEMPTGTGKTVVFSELLRAIHSGESSHNLKSLVLVPSKEILAQTIGSKETGQGLAVFAPELNVSAYYSGEKDTSGSVVVMTYASFNRAITSEKICPDDYDVLICDEAHRALGKTTKSNIDMFGEDKLAIGLTATSAFCVNRQVDSIFPTLIHRSELRDTIEQGTLAPVQAWLYKTGASIDADPDQFDFTAEELAKMANLDERNLRGVEFAKGFIEEGMQGVVSCLPGENLWHAKHIADMINSTVINDARTGEARYATAQAISGTMGMEERAAVYAAYNRGEIDVLTFVDTLNEGWDSKHAKFLINLRPTCSPVVGTQRLGRILRPGDNPDVVAQVVDFVDETKKAQFIALHALGEYRYVLGRVFGGNEGEGGIDYRKIQIPPELRSAISSVSHRAIKDIVVGRPYEATHTEQVTVHQLASEVGVDPLVALFVARDMGIELTAGFGGLTAPDKITLSDKDRETLIEAIHKSYLTTVDSEVVEELVKRQSQQFREQLTAQDAQRKDINSELFKNMPAKKVIKSLLSGRVEFDQLSHEVRERVIESELGVREITDILFGLHGYGNESLKRAALAKVNERPDGSALVLNCAVSLKYISEVRQNKSSKSQSEWVVSIIKNDGESVKHASAGNSKLEGMIARYKALANYVGLAEVAESIELDEEKLVVKKSPIQLVREYAQATSHDKGGQPLDIDTQHVVGGGQNAVFTSAIRLVRSWGVYEGSGFGRTAKEAERDAAQNMLDNSNIEESLDRRRQKKGSAKGTNEKNNTKSLTSIEQFFGKLKNHPNALIAHHGQLGNITDIEYELLDDSNANLNLHRYRVSFSDKNGARHEFLGHFIQNKKKAKISASMQALMSEPLVSFIPELKMLVDRDEV